MNPERWQQLKPEAADPPSPTLVGQNVGPYRIVREIGHGGMGTVYLAERADVDKRVALKLVRRFVTTRETTRRFLAERRILARLDHPNVARLLDAGMTDDGAPYFAMEYVEGRPLTDYCDERRLTIDDRLALFAEVCEAVRYAHQNLVIHRDLKPSNILIGEAEDGRPQVKLLDFGIAKLIDDDGEGLTRTGLQAMTPAYAAPEQVRAAAVTVATDVYGLGMILYELLVGRLPYDTRGRSPVRLDWLICEVVPPKPSTAVRRMEEPLHAEETTETTTAAVCAARSTDPARLRRHLGGDLDVICMKALAKEPARRYPSAEALLEDLKRHLAGRPIEARPSTVGYRWRKFVGRHRIGVATGVATAALIAALVGFYTWRLAEERDRVELERDRVEQELAKSEAVTTFLMDLFEAGDPRQSLGETLTVYDLLERGVARAEALADEPLVQAQMLGVIGEVYRSLGQYEAARPLLEQALALRRRTLEPRHPDLAESLDHLATLLRNLGDYTAAEPLVREALAARLETLGEAHPDVAQSLNSLATLLQAQGEYEEAETLFRKALDLRRRRLGETHFDTVTSMNNLALLLHWRGGYEEAETLLRRVVAIDRATLGETHPDMAVDLHNLAWLLMDLGSYDEAETLFQESLGMRRKTLGDQHPQVASSWMGIAELRRKQGRYDEAEQLVHRAMAISRAKLGETHPDTIAELRVLGVLRLLQGDPAAAEALLRQVLEMYRERLGTRHGGVAKAMRALADVLTATGDHAAAERYYRDALAIQQELLPAGHPDIAATRKGLAALQAAPGESE